MKPLRFLFFLLCLAIGAGAAVPIKDGVIQGSLSGTSTSGTLHIGSTGNLTIDSGAGFTVSNGGTLNFFGTAVTTKTGTGALVLGTSPTLTTPTLGAASATSINGMVLSGSGKTLTLAGDLSTSGSSAITLTSGGATNVTLPTTGTLSTLAGSETLTNKTLTSPTLTTPSLGVATATSINGIGLSGSGKTLTLAGNLTTSGSSAITLTSTGTTTATLPLTGTLATLAGSETFTNKTLTSPTLTAPTVNTSLTLGSNAAIAFAGTGAATTRDNLGLDGTIVCTGYSINLIIAPATGKNWLQWLALDPDFAHWTLVQKAVGGTTLQNAIDNFATEVAPYAPAITGKPLRVVCLTGGADLASLTAAQLYTLVGTYTTAVHGIGGTVMFGEIEPGGAWSATVLGRIPTYNALLAAGVLAGDFDHLITLAQLFPYTLDTGIFAADTQHFGNRGQLMLARAIKDAWGGAYTLGRREMINDLHVGPWADGGLRWESGDGTVYSQAAINGTNLLWTLPSGGMTLTNAGFGTQFTFSAAGVFAASGTASATAFNISGDTGWARSAAGVMKLTDASTGIRYLAGGAPSSVASAAALPVPTGSVFHVTGTTNITSMTATNLQSGVEFTMIFDGILTVTDGNNIKLNANTNFITAAGSVLKVVFDGTNFYELGRFND